MHLPSYYTPLLRFGALSVVSTSCILVWRGSWLMWDVAYEYMMNNVTKEVQQEQQQSTSQGFLLSSDFTRKLLDNYSTTRQIVFIHMLDIYIQLAAVILVSFGNWWNCEDKIGVVTGLLICVAWMMFRELVQSSISLVFAPQSRWHHHSL